MADDKRISELPLATTPLAGTEEQEIVQGGVNKRVAVSNVGGGGGTVTSVTGTTNRIDVDLTNPAVPVIDIDAAYDAIIAAKAPLASPALTGTPTVNGESVSPGLEAIAATGTAIAFAVPQTYGSVASPETGNVTLNSTGLIPGMVQLLLHNSAIAPTFGAEFAKIGGNYQSSQLNSIYFHAVSATRIEYTINQTS